VKMDRIRRALAAGDAEAVVQAAHALRSSCGMLGAARMAGAFACMEDAAAGGDLAGAARAFQDADDRLPAVLEALSALE